MNIKVRVAIFAPLLALIGGCASTGGGSSVDPLDRSGQMSVPTSYLDRQTVVKESEQVVEVDIPIEQGDNNALPTAPRSIEPLDWQASTSNLVPLPIDLFSTDLRLSVAAEKMALRDFIHYIFGKILNVNYVVDEAIESGASAAASGITLSIPEQLSARALFRLVNELLIARDVQIKYANQTFFIYRQSSSADAPQVVIAIGREPSDVPETAQQIMQVVPLKFGVKITLERTLRTLTKAKITPDFSQSTVFVEGKRDDVLRALELIEMLDTPAMRGRHIGLVELTYLEPKVFSKQVLTLLQNEGIDAAVGGPNNKSLVLVPLEQLGALVVFATNKFLLDRVHYWAELTDVAGEGPDKQYFVYHPRFARAIDLHKSISSLLGLGGSDIVPDNEGGSTGNAPSTQRTGGVNSKDISLVVDEKANVLVFYTPGQRYRALLPLIGKLDVMPKQVMLDIIIAEVSMKDEFKHGVEWALTQGEVSLTTNGAFNVGAIGGFGININGMIDGTSAPLVANFLATNSLVNILSQPTLMVRDGVAATINVGSNISVIGQTTTDPISGERQTTTSVYRQTGVKLAVTPTVNASGIVVMEVSQSISNSVPGSGGASGNPDIFDRSITTEVLARSGQTVMLGGLISENRSVGGSGVPGLAKLPILGNLFKAQSDATDRTELVMLITPRVVEDLSGWEPLMEDFRRGLRFFHSDGQ